MGLEQDIKDKARELGFDAAGITDASPISQEHTEHLTTWLRRGYAGRMDYMHRDLEKRIDPTRLRKGAESVVIVALNYKPPESTAPAGTTPQDRDTGRVALYAQYEDYHPFIRSLLRELAGFLSVRSGRPVRYRICVDSAPLAEKALAVRAGLGFIGRNRLLTHPQLGPQVLLGALVTTLALQPDEPGAQACRRCGRCVEACPTGALRPDGFLDARRCISYLTQYEPHDGPDPPVGQWLFGCDACLLACPFHQDAPPRTNTYFRFHGDRARLDLRDVLALTDEAFASRFRDSPIRRAGLERLKRNARACLRSSTTQ